MTNLEKKVLNAIEEARKHPDTSIRVGNLMYTIELREETNFYLVMDEGERTQMNQIDDPLVLIVEQFVNYIKAH